MSITHFAEVEAQIRQLYAHYTDAVWRKDPTAFGQCFAPEAEWRIAGMVMHGRDEIASGFEHIMSNANRVLITFGTPQLDWREDQAMGRIYATEQCSWRDKQPNMNIGRYFERYVYDGDRWRFSWRLFQLLYQGPADLSGPHFDVPDFGPWPAMPPQETVPLPSPARAVGWPQAAQARG
ncbi:nuclear transport factor 2 family protein [Novosphingobium sp. M1R2S20]|uniref:Nuclear transport factor 2 family protein n=1 Tax=Novosphingobium rhizovicinum TaxID=3228928 RepID=A0ABV3RDW5_9SPHN